MWILPVPILDPPMYAPLACPCYIHTSAAGQRARPAVWRTTRHIHIAPPYLRCPHLDHRPVIKHREAPVMRRTTSLIAGALALALVNTGCSSSKDDDSKDGAKNDPLTV